MTSLAVQTGAKDRHQRDDVTSKLFLEGFLCTNFEYIDFSAHSTANLSNQTYAETQESILMHDGEFFHTPVKQLSQQGTQPRFVAVESGTDILYHFLASGLTQTCRLSTQIIFLIV